MIRLLKVIGLYRRWSERWRRSCSRYRFVCEGTAGVKQVAGDAERSTRRRKRAAGNVMLSPPFTLIVPAPLIVPPFA